mmetsp:Transcript_3114/g.4586  ORF Transcript_3114/g.4586 Transcript_3114/m.4586 type:complete len:232 (+) Transcript_3114:133-828(+)
MKRKHYYQQEMPGMIMAKKQASTSVVLDRFNREERKSQYDQRLKDHLEKYKSIQPTIKKQQQQKPEILKKGTFQFPLPPSMVYKEPEPINYVKEKAKSIVEGEKKAMELGPSFIQYYYTNFDEMNMQHRYHMLTQVYCTQTKMTYNGRLGRNQEESMKLAMTIPPVVKRHVKHIDCQPYLSTNAAVMISVTGDIQLIEGQTTTPKKFIENFILMPFGKNKYYIQHQNLRLL